MPTLRELRAENRRSAVSRTISCRSARDRRVGAGPSSDTCRGRAAAVTAPMVQHVVTDRFAARRGPRPLPGAGRYAGRIPGRRGSVVRLGQVRTTALPGLTAGPARSGAADPTRVGQQSDHRCLGGARLRALGPVHGLVVHLVAVVLLHEHHLPPAWRPENGLRPGRTRSGDEMSVTGWPTDRPGRWRLVGARRYASENHSHYRCRPETRCAPPPVA